MKKLLLALALCSMAIPSVGFAESQKNGYFAESIITQGVTLDKGFDTKKGLAYFVKYCDKSFVRGWGNGGSCWAEDYDGIWFCTVSYAGASICKRSY